MKYIKRKFYENINLESKCIQTFIYTDEVSENEDRITRPKMIEIFALEL